MSCVLCSSLVCSPSGSGLYKARTESIKHFKDRIHFATETSTLNLAGGPRPAPGMPFRRGVRCSMVGARCRGGCGALQRSLREVSREFRPFASEYPSRLYAVVPGLYTCKAIRFIPPVIWTIYRDAARGLPCSVGCK